MPLNVGFTITPATLPWLAGAMAFKSVDNTISKIASGNATLGSGTADPSFSFSIFGGPHVDDLLVLNLTLAIEEGAPAGFLTFTDTSGNTYNAGTQELYVDVNGRTYIMQQFWSIITTSPGFLSLNSSIITDNYINVVAANCEWVYYRSDTTITQDGSPVSAQGTSGDGLVTIDPVSATPTVIGLCLVDGLEDTAFPPGIGIDFQSPFSGFLFAGGQFGPGNTTQVAGWVGVYIVYGNTGLTLIITADNQTKEFGTEFIFTGTEFTNTPLQSGDFITSCAIDSLGSPADAPIGDYVINISSALGSGLEKYLITYIPGDMTVTGMPPPPGCFLVDFPLVGPFLDATGQPLANGVLSVRLVFDCNCPCADYQITGNNHSTLNLDENGLITGTPQIRPNDQLSPIGSYYIVQVYSNEGQLVLGPKVLQISSE